MVKCVSKVWQLTRHKYLSPTPSKRLASRWYTVSGRL